jgi:choloylglycine hydrolase
MSHTPFAVLALSALIGAAWPGTGRACTTFAMVRGAEVVVGKSYDFKIGHGLLMVNKRGVAKQALLPPGARGRPARWIARHGSLTFNQIGRELPAGGMNERGLVVEVMWLTTTRHGKPSPKRATVNELQWIQYLLDTSATIEEAIINAKRLQVSKAYAAVHYMACDRSGACATFEYLGGKLVVHRGEELPVRVLTNDPYSRSVAKLRQHTGFGGKLPTPTSASSLDRFTRAATLVRRGARMRGSSVQYAFKVLQRVRIGDYSKWQIVYEPVAGRVHFRNAGERTHVTVDARKQDYSCATPVKVMDLRGTVLGKRGAWATYSAKHNLKLIRDSFTALGIRFPDAVVEQFAAYPDRASRCIPASRSPKASKQKAKKRRSPDDKESPR